MRRRHRKSTAAELALFAQDRWRIGSRVTLELGLRIDREDVIERVNWSPRGGVSVGVLPEGRGILRGGVGRFRQRTPLNVGAFGQFESRIGHALRADGELARSARDARERSGAGPADARGRDRQRRMEPAVRPARAVQSQLPEAARDRTSTSSSRTPRAARSAC